MKRIFIYELKRFRKERGLICTLFLMVLSFSLSFGAVSIYEGYQEEVIKPFKEKENRVFETTNKYWTYSVKGFNTLMQPAYSSVSIDPTAYESVFNTKLDVNMDNRLTSLSTKKDIVDIPFLIIFMLAGLYYGSSISFIAGSRAKTFIVRMGVFLSAVLLIVTPRLITLFFVPAKSQDFYISLKYWLMVTVLTCTSYCLGVLSNLFKMRKDVAVFSFIVLLCFLHLMTVLFVPDRLNVDGAVHSRKFKDMMDFQAKESFRLKGIEGKENIRAVKLDIAQKFIYEVFPGMVDYQKRFVDLAEKIERKRADISIISPLAYDSVFKSIGARGNRYHFTSQMIDLEYQFLKYTWENRYSADKPEFKQFEGSEENVYTAGATVPHNFGIALTIYTLLSLGLACFVVSRLNKKVVVEDQLDLEPGFRYEPELADPEREEQKQLAIANGYFCIDDETISSYPKDLTIAEVLSIDPEKKSILKEKVGDFFDKKIRKLYSGDLITSVAVAAVLIYDNIVIDNIAIGYPIQVKRKFTYLIDDLKREEQVILYLSNSSSTLNMSDPPECEGVIDIKGPLEINTDYEIV